jgi:hypothetical protein
VTRRPQQQSCDDEAQLTGPHELVNTDRYGPGRLFDVETGPAALSQQLAALMDARAYRDLAGA